MLKIKRVVSTIVLTCIKKVGRHALGRLAGLSDGE